MSNDVKHLKAQVFESLHAVSDPDSGCSIVEMGMLRHCNIAENGKAEVAFEVRNEAHAQILAESIRGALEGHGWKETEIRYAAGEDTRPAPKGDRKWIPGVRNVVGIGAGKGGVGKSTVSVNLALALSQRGLKVGLLDGDIYGPNIPLMMGITDKPNVVDEKIIPIEAHGLKVMSLGMLIGEDDPVVWRGPMLHTAVGQFLFDVAWGDLDYLIIDMPPGTGDVSLSLSQKTLITGCVAICTPSMVAVQDVRKAIAMFRKLENPVLGLVENMRGFACPKCGEVTEIFDSGEAERTAERAEVPYLGHVPLHTALREGGDTGRPVQVHDPDGPVAERFREIASLLGEQVAQVNFARLGEDDLVQIQL